MYISQTHFGFTNLGSNFHNLLVKAFWIWKFWSGTPCTFSRQIISFVLLVHMAFGFIFVKRCFHKTFAKRWKTSIISVQYAIDLLKNGHKYRNTKLAEGRRHFQKKKKKSKKTVMFFCFYFFSIFEGQQIGFWTRDSFCTCASIVSLQ